METQSYKNYIRFYTPHHFVFYPMMAVLLGFSIYFALTSAEKLVWTFISLLFIAVIWLSYMVRQHYALTLQNRIVRLEMRYRYLALTGKPFEPIEEKLRDSQLFALRFCPDEEFQALLQRTLAENLSGDQIKKAIVNWKGDHHRV